MERKEETHTYPHHTPYLGPATSFRQRHWSHYSTGLITSRSIPIFLETIPDS